MFQDIHSIPWEAAINPNHLEGTFNIVYLRQWLCTSAQNFHLLIKKSLYEIFSLRQKYSMKNHYCINVNFKTNRIHMFLETGKILKVLIFSEFKGYK